jgi:long-subunit fatty acid transport protein
MKKIILTAAAVFAFSFANAQETKFGAKVALNIASVTGDIENTSSIIGFQVGGFAEIKISEKFAIQPELLYSTQGVEESYSEDELEIKNTIKLGYINVPVMAKYYATTKFSLEFGPQIGFLTSAKAEFEAEGESLEVDIKDDLESVDFGLNFGAGYDFTNNFSAGVRYNLGLSNVAKSESGDDNTIKNSVFSVAVGYKF